MRVPAEQSHPSTMGKGKFKGGVVNQCRFLLSNDSHLPCSEGGTSGAMMAAECSPVWLAEPSTTPSRLNCLVHLHCFMQPKSVMLCVVHAVALVSIEFWVRRIRMRALR